MGFVRRRGTGATCRGVWRRYPHKAELRPCLELAGLKYRDLRRTLIVRLAEAGVDLPGTAAISGHRIET